MNSSGDILTIPGPIWEERRLMRAQGASIYTLYERAYDTHVEWWGIAFVNVKTPQGVIPAQVPFKIAAENRTDAFDNAESSWHAQAPALLEQLRGEYNAARIRPATGAEAAALIKPA